MGKQLPWVAIDKIWQRFLGRPFSAATDGDPATTPLPVLPAAALPIVDIAHGGTGKNTLAGAVGALFPTANTNPGYVAVFNSSFANSGHLTIPQLKTLLGIGTGGGGFNTRTMLTSGTSYTAPVTGWYKVTVIGGGGGGGAGGAYGKPSNAGDYIAGGGGGGGASGGVAVQYKKFTAGQVISYAIGVAGVTGGGAAQSGGANNGSVGTATTFNGITAPGGSGGYGGSNYTNAGWGGRGGSAVAGGTAGNTGSGGGQSTYAPSVTPGAGGVGGNNGTGYGSGLGGKWGHYAVTHNGWPINGGPVVNGAVILEYNNPAI